MHWPPSRQLYPLEVNPATEELFLRLQQHKNIIVTPPRLSDGPAIVHDLSSPLVYHWLSSVPTPYHLKYAEAWLQRTTVETTDILKSLQEAKDADKLVYANGCPVRSIREVKEDGTDLLLGDVSIRRSKYGEIMGPGGEVDWDNKEAMEEQNNRREAGDPDIIWMMAFYLTPSHHRRGIMADAVATIMHDWAIPRLNAHQILVNVFEGNEGSMGVFRKNGFTLTRTIPDHIESKGVKRTTHVLEWCVNP